ncbi:hypothetical protein B0H14DRAFT_3134698 [Mycena olivaceomarginata]|nr:hypothetical protein B0H14DRAFT_3134698 [Mycena olivaceomarginata]
MPHGVDPTDYRAFYLCTANEVKHRKRTTSAQLKVLGSIFERDTKPNAALRTELAAQLNMTARGVQFQNRRAKEKTNATKGLKFPLTIKEVDSTLPRSLEDPDTCESPSEQLPELSTNLSPSPTGTKPPRLHVVTDSGDSSWQGSPVIETPEDPPFDLPSLHMVHSLPVNALGHSGKALNAADRALRALFGEHQKATALNAADRALRALFGEPLESRLYINSVTVFVAAKKNYKKCSKEGKEKERQKEKE